MNNPNKKKLNGSSAEKPYQIYYVSTVCAHMSVSISKYKQVDMDALCTRSFHFIIHVWHVLAWKLYIHYTIVQTNQGETGYTNEEFCKVSFGIDNDRTDSNCDYKQFFILYLDHDLAWTEYLWSFLELVRTEFIVINLFCTQRFP